MAILETINLTKTYRKELPFYRHIFSPFAKKQQILALDSVSISIEPGKILAVIGPNGAGKTTLLRIIANLLDADCGTVKLFDQILNGASNLRSNIGYVSNDERSFFWRLTGKQNLEFFAKLYGISNSAAHARIDVLLNWFDLSKKSNEPFSNYSNGTKKKFSIVRALIHQPKILLLDEVTNSLDPISSENVKILVREYVTHQKGICALWSTHRFEEVCEICDKILVLYNGQNKFFGKPFELINKFESEIINKGVKSKNDSLIYCLKSILTQKN